MPDAFFQSDRKRKRPPRAGPSNARGSSGRGGRGGSRGRGGGWGGRDGSRSRPRGGNDDEDLSSDAEGDGRHVDIDDMDLRANRNLGEGGDSFSDDGFVDANETAAEKRVRMAKGYLQKIKDEVEAAREEGDYDAAEIDREIIASRLKQDVDEAEGRIHLFLASHLTTPITNFIPLSAHIPTSLAVTPQTIYVSTKRGSILPFSLPSLRQGTPFGQAHPHTSGKGKSGKIRVNGGKITSAVGGAGEEGHNGELLAIAASEDGKWLVSGGRDKVVGVWDVSDTPKWVAGMRGHKDAISSLVLPPLSNPSAHILSASLSRHLTLHSLSTLSALDTFFGHQDVIGSVSALKPTDAVTSGARDRTCRWWKVEEEVQLVFRGGGKVRVKGDDAEVERGNGNGKEREFVEGSIDVVCVLDDSHFLSGGDSGTIALWSTGKKKPIFSQALAHGTDDSTYNPLLPSPSPSPPNASLSSARWITSLAFLRGTNLFASGSWDGIIRLWGLDESLRSFSLVKEIQVGGFVNSLSLLAVPKSVFGSESRMNGEEDKEGEGEEDRLKGSRVSKEIVLAAAISQEPRLGRWFRLKERNGLLFARLPLDRPFL